MSEQVKFEKMFEPIKIKDIEIRNRLAMAPINNNFPQDGQVTEQLIAYLAERSRNGTGLIVTAPGIAGVGPPVSGARLPSYRLTLLNPGYIAGWNELIETIHAFGAKVFCQVMAGGAGRQTRKGVLTRAPSPLPMRIPPENLPVKCREFEERRNLPSVWEHLMEGVMPQEITIEEIVAIEDAYAEGARLVKGCGADGVELHLAHGYLGYSFLSPRTNLRNDLYGGNFENRIRFLTNILTKVRHEVGDSFVVGIRISGDEHMPGGLGVEETSRILTIAEEMGLDYVHLTNGCYEAAKWYVPDEDGTMLVEAEVLKKTLRIPIITPSIHDPVTAEKALQEGKTDMISLGRSLLADSEWVKKVSEGHHHKIVKCIRCLTCLRRIRNGLTIRCEVNPNLGAERYTPGNHRINAPHRKVLYYPGT